MTCQRQIDLARLCVDETLLLVPSTIYRSQTSGHQYFSRLLLKQIANLQQLLLPPDKHLLVRCSPMLSLSWVERLQLTGYVYTHGVHFFAGILSQKAPKQFVNVALFLFMSGSVPTQNFPQALITLPKEKDHCLLWFARTFQMLY